MTDPTQKQLDFIADIQYVTGAEFKGATKQEASEYIDANIDDFYRIVEEGRALDDAVMDSLHGDWGDRDD